MADNAPVAPVTSNVTPDLSNLSNVKAEGSLVKPNGEPINKGTDTKGAPVTAADKAEIKTAIEKIKIGEGEEYTVAEMKALIEKSKGADKKFLEASKAKKEAMRVFKMAKEDPKGFLEKTGLDPKKFAYDEVAEDVKNQLRDPREIELEKAQKRIKEFEEREATEKQTREQARLEREAKAIEQRFHAEAIEALEAFPQLPKTARIVAELARAVDQVRQKHGVLLSMKEVAPLVVKEVRSGLSGVLRGASPEQLIDLIGQEAVDAILKHSLTKVKDPLKGGKAGAAGEAGSAKPEEKKWKSSHEYWKSIDRAAKEERERGGR
jgi:hypothetical protein